VEIETLKFRVIPEERVDDFIDADTRVWEPWLQQQRGYLRKVAQVYPGGIVHLRIFWASKRDWDNAAKDPIHPVLTVRLQSEFLGVFQLLP